MIKFLHPFTMMVAGPSGCGKTTFVQELIRNREFLIDPQIHKIIWCNTESNAVPRDFFKTITLSITCNNEIPSNEDIANEGHYPLLIILDDMMLETYNSRVCELFTKGSHHRNISVILITQNVFHQGKYCRDISLNCKYMVIFKNPRDRSQILPLARQIYPENSASFLRVYNEATSIPHGYIVLDLTQRVSDLLRFRSDIFNRDYCVCYCSLQHLQNKKQCYKNETVEGQQTYTTCAEKL